MQNWKLTELDSGERVISEPLDHMRSAAVGFWIGAGSRDETPTQAGVPPFIEHLLFKGRDRYRAVDIAHIFDGRGGALHAAADGMPARWSPSTPHTPPHPPATWTPSM